MARIFIISTLLLSLCLLMPAQQYIGLHKNVIKQMMKSENNELYLDESTINKTYKYLKYVDALGQQTLLYFLDEDDKCKLIRYMCDYSLLNEQIERLDQSYTKKDENSWQYKEDGEIYEISLEEKDWYFVITTSKK